MANIKKELTQANATKQQIANSLSMTSINMSPIYNSVKTFWKFDPFIEFESLELLRNSAFLEFGAYSGRDINDFRRMIASLTPFPLIRLFAFNDPNFDNVQPLTGYRHASFVLFPILQVLYFTSTVIASDEQSRIKLFAKLRGLKSIPSIFYTSFKKFRKSECSRITTTPLIDFSSNDRFTNEYSVFKNTFYDFRFLRTEAGINAVSELLYILQESEKIRNYYVNMEPYSEENVVSFYSGTKTTLCSVFTTDYSNGTIVTQLLQGNSIDLTSNDLPYCTLISAFSHASIIDRSNQNEYNFVGNPANLVYMFDNEHNILFLELNKLLKVDEKHIGRRPKSLPKYQKDKSNPGKQPLLKTDQEDQNDPPIRSSA